MKVGIISEFKRVTVNYGNNLQAYALNAFVRELCPDSTVETLYFSKEAKYRVTSTWELLKKVYQKAVQQIGEDRQIASDMIDRALVRERLDSFCRFQRDHIPMSPEPMEWEKLRCSDYDIFIVGSDVVWSQRRARLDRIKFLDFQNTKNAKKIAYAASFGRNWIPKENESAIRRCLADYKAISVREKSAVKMLEGIEVRGVVHALDPTLLLPKEHWERLESQPTGVPVNEPYVLIYFLGATAEQKIGIERLSQADGLKIVNIPYAKGRKEYGEMEFGDIQVQGCSPQEWLWLIHHAEYVITDSFHGIAFATIFGRKFFALHRNYIIDINVRLTDFLETIGQKDKFIEAKALDDIGAFQWNYRDIGYRLEEKIAASRQFLMRALMCEGGL